MTEKFIIELFFFFLFVRGALCPVVQSIVTLTSSLVVKRLTALVSTISNLQVFLLKNVSRFAKATHIFFQQKY